MKDLSTIDDRFFKEMNSIVCGRRNYVIITYDNKIYFTGGWGQAKREGALRSRFLWEVLKHNIWTFEYTYKKDFDAAKEKLERIIKEWEEST